MPYIAPEVITEAKRMDLLTYLREYEPGELVKFSSNTYTTRTHDSLKISNGKWMWWSRGIGGKSALDYLIKVRGMDFVQAVQTIMGNGSVSFPTCENIKSYEEQPLLLPEKSPTADVVFDYLFGRGIDYEIINHCLEQELIIESLPYHNAVFIGYDENKEPKYAAYRATNQSRIMGDCTGSKKQYSFRLTAENTGEVHLFECAIDLLSYATLMKLEGKDWRQFIYNAINGKNYLEKMEVETLVDCNIFSGVDELLISWIIGRLENEDIGATLIEKIHTMTSPGQASKLKRNNYVVNRIKPDNEQIYYIIDAINDAINAGKQISFQYYDYTGLKKKVLKNKGEVYKLSPYKLLWCGDYYYVLGYSEKKSKVINFRVDRIASKPEILDKDIIPMPDDFDIENYTKEVFFMFSGEKVLVDLRCDNSLMKTMVDRFGEEVTTLAYDMTSFRIKTEVSASPTFFGWVFGFNGKVQILAPESVKEQYRQMIAQADEGMQQKENKEQEI